MHIWHTHTGAQVHVGVAEAVQKGHALPPGALSRICTTLADRICANPEPQHLCLYLQGGRKRVQSAHARLTSSPEAIAADMAALDHFDQKVGYIAPKPKHQKTRVPRTTR